MKRQKGFSLFEVLVCLMLVSTMALVLVQQQGRTRQLLSQLVLYARASQFLDTIDEYLYVKKTQLPVPQLPYHFEVKKSQLGIILSIDWFKDLGSITRNYARLDK